MEVLHRTIEAGKHAIEKVNPNAAAIGLMVIGGLLALNEFLPRTGGYSPIELIHTFKEIITSAGVIFFYKLIEFGLVSLHP